MINDYNKDFCSSLSGPPEIVSPASRLTFRPFVKFITMLQHDVSIFSCVPKQHNFILIHLKLVSNNAN